MADPQQELFSYVKVELEKKHSVYDSVLPPEGTLYPFIYLGDFTQNDNINKSSVFGVVRPTIHVYSNNVRKRGDLSKILLYVKEVLYRIDRTNNFSWSVKNVNQRILPDNTTKTPLLHGLIEAELEFS